MVSQEEMEQAIARAIARAKAEERVKAEQKLKAFGGIIGEILTSQGTLFRPEAELEKILKKKIEDRKRRLKLVDFTSKEIAFLREVILLARRDEQISHILSDPIRNNSTILGGFARRIRELCKEKLKDIETLSKEEMKEVLLNILGPAEIIAGRVAEVEDEFNNRGNKKKGKAKKKGNQ
jgi:hypothetical protein